MIIAHSFVWKCTKPWHFIRFDKHDDYTFERLLKTLPNLQSSEQLILCQRNLLEQVFLWKLWKYMQIAVKMWHAMLYPVKSLAFLSMFLCSWVTVPRDILLVQLCFYTCLDCIHRWNCPVCVNKRVFFTREFVSNFITSVQAIPW